MIRFAPLPKSWVILAITAITALIGATSPAHANQGTTSTALAIQATIKPKACNPQFNNGGKIDFGTVDLDSLARDSLRNSLGQRDVEFQVYCAKDVKIRVKVADERRHTAAATNTGVEERFRYGLGMQNGKQKIGSYVIDFSPTNQRSDGFTMTASDDNGVTWHKPRSAHAGPDRWLAWSATPDQIAGTLKTFKAGLKVTVELVPTSELDLSREIRLDGFSTFEIRYE